MQADNLTLDPRLSFSKVVPRHQIAWDNTSLSALKRCPRYYQYNILEGYATRGENIHLRFGIEYGDALSTWNKAQSEGKSKVEAQLVALRFALERTWDETLNRPWTSDDTYKNRETLIRTLIWYMDQYEDDNCKTLILSNGKPAVELGFRLDTDLPSSLSGEYYQLCGYMDRIVTFNGAIYISDKKTTKHYLDDKYFAQYSPENQVTQYTAAGAIVLQMPVAGFFIDAAQVGVTFSRFERKIIPRATQHLEEWFTGTMFYIKQNETYVKENFWPMNESSCSLYGGCAFREICSLSPDLRQLHLDKLFYRRVWDPLTVREI
jgi:hypothetical protein